MSRWQVLTEESAWNELQRGRGSEVHGWFAKRLCKQWCNSHFGKNNWRTSFMKKRENRIPNSLLERVVWNHLRFFVCFGVLHFYYKSDPNFVLRPQPFQSPHEVRALSSARWNRRHLNIQSCSFLIFLFAKDGQSIPAIVTAPTIAITKAPSWNSIIISLENFGFAYLKSSKVIRLIWINVER